MCGFSSFPLLDSGTLKIKNSILLRDTTNLYILLLRLREDKGFTADIKSLNTATFLNKDLKIM